MTLLSLRQKLTELRKTFLKIPRSHLRIALMLEDKKMTKAELLEVCAKLGRSRETVERQIRYMLADKTLCETREGLLYLHNPRRYYYVVLYGKGTILARWFALTIPTSVLAYFFTYINMQATQFLIVLLLLMSIGFLVDLRLHRIF